MNPTMMLITSTWNDLPTFKMMPICTECPYNEAIYDPMTKALAIVSKEKKQTFHLLPKLDSNGFPMMIQGRKGNMEDMLQKERKMLDTFYEYYITEPEEITAFVKQFACNHETFDISGFLSAEPVEELQQAA